MSYQKEIFKLSKDVSKEKKLIAFPIAWLKAFDVNTCIFLSQLLYWSDKGFLEDGWIYKTYNEWQNETGLGRKAIKRIWGQLKDHKIIEVKNKRVSGHPKLHYRVLKENLEQFICDKVGVPTVEPSAKGANLKCPKEHPKMSKGANTYTENTTKNTKQNSLRNKFLNDARSKERDKKEIFNKAEVNKLFNFYLGCRNKLTKLCASENIEDKKYLQMKHKSVKSKVTINTATKESKTLAEIINDAINNSHENMKEIATALENYTIYAFSHSKKENKYWYNIPHKNLGLFLHSGTYKEFLDLSKWEKKGSSEFKPISSDLFKNTDYLNNKWKDRNKGSLYGYIWDIKEVISDDTFEYYHFVWLEECLTCLTYKKHNPEYTEEDVQLCNELMNIWRDKKSEIEKELREE